MWGPRWRNPCGQAISDFAKLWSSTLGPTHFAKDRWGNPTLPSPDHTSIIRRYLRNELSLTFHGAGYLGFERTWAWCYHWASPGQDRDSAARCWCCQAYSVETYGEENSARGGIWVGWCSGPPGFSKHTMTWTHLSWRDSTNPRCQLRQERKLPHLDCLAHPRLTQVLCPKTSSLRRLHPPTSGRSHSLRTGGPPAPRVMLVLGVQSRATSKQGHVGYR